MRHTEPGPHLRARAISGTRVVLIALDMDEDQLDGLRGFAFQRCIDGGPAQWLRGLKFFKDLVPAPKKGDTYSTREQPIQSFIWSDYEARPDTKHAYSIVALYCDIHNLEERHKISFEIRTEKENDGKHGIWVNRGAIASHAFSVRFQNKELTEEMYNNVDENNKVVDEETVWLSRGLEEACVGFINDTPASDALRVCAYEFTYEPLLKALIAALDRGVDVQIIYHKTSANDSTIQNVGLSKTKNRKKVLFERTRPQKPHNKFIVRLEGGKDPVAVWTGSTNFTPSGFFGQTNVGHIVEDSTTAGTYLKYWTELSDNPTGKPAREAAVRLTPNPENLIAKTPITEVFSPRVADNMLDWYGVRIEDAATCSMFTAAFTVDPIILRSLAKKMDSVRFVLLERPPTATTRAAERANPGQLLLSNGAVLGKMPEQKFEEREGAGGKKLVPIPEFPLEKWFVDEELSRRNAQGFVFFIHTKFLLVDPLSDDPLVCTGSANFSGNSLTANDENMLLIRGNTRVADIYVTEFDRIFRHFYFRDVANEQANKGNDEKADLAVHLDTTPDWIKPYFKDGNFKNSRRIMFFRDTSMTWVTKAPNDADVFGDEEQRAKDRRKSRSTGTANAEPGKKKKTNKAKAPAKWASKKRNSTKKAARKPAAKKSSKRKKAVRRTGAKGAARKRFSAKR